MSVYEKVRAYIDESGLKQVVIAKKAGIPIATFNAILNGKRKMHADDLRAICIALNVGPEAFIEFKELSINSVDYVCPNPCLDHERLQEKKTN